MFAHMPHRSYIVGVTGGSGSGKTSCVRRLRERLGDGATFISQDDYYVPTDAIAVDGEGVHNFDLPGSIDSAAMAADLERLLAGETLQRTRYTFQTVYAEGETSVTGKVGAAFELRPAAVIVVEGLFAFHEARLREHMDLKIFVDASDVAKLTRRIKRDRVERALPLEDVLYRYERHVRPAYRRYIAPYREYADIVVNNEASMDLGLTVVVDHLRTKL